MTGRINRIPSLDFTSSSAERVGELCNRLDIRDPRDRIDRAIKALERLWDVSGGGGTGDRHRLNGQNQARGEDQVMSDPPQSVNLASGPRLVDTPIDAFRLRLVVHDADGRTGADESDANLLICSSDGCPCAGRERIRKIDCRPGPGRYYFRIPLAGGIPGDDYTVSLSSGEQVHGVLNERGKHKARFQDVIEPKGVATAVWGCGATDELAYACP